MVVSHQEGQSLVEFLLALPFLFFITILMIKINTVIQYSIVNQRYVRETAVFSTASSPYTRIDFMKEIAQIGENRIVMGVAQDPIPANVTSGASTRPPRFKIQRSGVLREVNDKDLTFSNKEQGTVRVSTTLSICTPYQIHPTDKRLLTPADYFNGMPFNFCNGETP
jgi:hypothetical protein